jgi:hypothetical protein
MRLIWDICNCCGNSEEITTTTIFDAETCALAGYIDFGYPNPIVTKSLLVGNTLHSGNKSFFDHITKVLTFCFTNTYSEEEELRGNTDSIFNFQPNGVESSTNVSLKTFVERWDSRFYPISDPNESLNYYYKYYTIKAPFYTQTREDPSILMDNSQLLPYQTCGSIYNPGEENFTRKLNDGSGDYGIFGEDITPSIGNQNPNEITLFELDRSVRNFGLLLKNSTNSDIDTITITFTGFLDDKIINFETQIFKAANETAASFLAKLNGINPDVQFTTNQTLAVENGLMKYDILFNNQYTLLVDAAKAEVITCSEKTKYVVVYLTNEQINRINNGEPVNFFIERNFKSIQFYPIQDKITNMNNYFYFPINLFPVSLIEIDFQLKLAVTIGQERIQFKSDSTKEHINVMLANNFLYYRINFKNRTGQFRLIIYDTLNISTGWVDIVDSGEFDSKYLKHKYVSANSVIFYTTKYFQNIEMFSRDQIPQQNKTNWQFAKIENSRTIGKQQYGYPEPWEFQKNDAILHHSNGRVYLHGLRDYYQFREEDSNETIFSTDALKNYTEIYNPMSGVYYGDRYLYSLDDETLRRRVTPILFELNPDTLEIIKAQTYPEWNLNFIYFPEKTFTSYTPKMDQRYSFKFKKELIEFFDGFLLYPYVYNADMIYQYTLPDYFPIDNYYFIFQTAEKFSLRNRIFTYNGELYLLLYKKIQKYDKNLTLLNEIELYPDLNTNYHITAAIHVNSYGCFLISYIDGVTLTKYSHNLEFINSQRDYLLKRYGGDFFPGNNLNSEGNTNIFEKDGQIYFNYRRSYRKLRAREIPLYINDEVGFNEIIA